MTPRRGMGYHLRMDEEIVFEAPSAAEYAVRTYGLTKVYGGAERVSDVSLGVRRGEVYGLVSIQSLFNRST